MGALNGPLRRTGLMHREEAKAILVLLEQLAILFHQLEARRRVFRGAPVGFVEGAARGDDGRLNILGGSIGSLAGDFASPRIDHIEGAAASGGTQLAINEKLGVGKDCHLSVSCFRVIRRLIQCLLPVTETSLRCTSDGLSTTARNASVTEL